MKNPTYIADMLYRYARKRPLRLHMPGHKGRMGKDIFDSRLDITELGFSDDLRNSGGAILESERLCARLYKTKRALYTVGGATSGVHAFVAASKGKILTDSSCHVSVDNAAEIFGKTLVKLEKPKFSALSLDDVKRAIDNDGEIGTVLLTSPDYFGLCAPLEKIRGYLAEKNIMFFVDGAHGAHFGLDDEHLPACPAKFCDAAVVSCHKTLPAPTQTAAILTNSDILADELKKKLNMLCTTSPSYILLAGLDRAIAYCGERAQKRLAELYYWLLVLKFRLALLDVPVLENDDFTRIVMDMSVWGVSGKAVFEYLCKKNIFAEMYCDDKVVLLFSMKNDRWDVRRVINAMSRLSKNKPPKEKATGTGPFEYPTKEQNQL